MTTNKQRTRVKICGLTNLQDARFASGALADYLGFIFYEGSPRYIEPSKAGAIINWIEGPKCVGVFVNQPLDDVNMIARQTGIDMVQLHGEESPDYCELVEKPIIKAVHVGESDTAETVEQKANAYRETADYLLFDTKIDGLWGGTGTPFEWDLLSSGSKDLRFFLSGGIDAGNVGQACKIARPFAVDLSSSLESEPGKKDFDKVETFMDAMRKVWKEEENPSS